MHCNDISIFHELQIVNSKKLINPYSKEISDNLLLAPSVLRNITLKFKSSLKIKTISDNFKI